MHLGYLPTFGITIVFDFSWDDCNIQEKLKTMDNAKFGGGGWGKQDKYGLVKMVNSGPLRASRARARELHENNSINN